MVQKCFGHVETQQKMDVKEATIMVNNMTNRNMSYAWSVIRNKPGNMIL